MFLDKGLVNGKLFFFKKNNFPFTKPMRETFLHYLSKSFEH